MPEQVRNNSSFPLVRIGSGVSAVCRKMKLEKGEGRPGRIKFVLELSENAKVLYNIKREDLDVNGFYICDFPEEMVVQAIGSNTIDILCGLKEEKTKLTELHDYLLSKVDLLEKKNSLLEEENEKLKEDVRMYIESGFNELLASMIEDAVRKTIAEVFAQRMVPQQRGETPQYG